MEFQEIEIGEAAEFAVGELVWRTAGPWSLIVCRLESGLVAIENRCSHQERPMDRAKRDGTTVICPHHGVCYDLRDGSVAWDQGFFDLIPCRSFPVTETAGTVTVTVPAGD